MRRALCSLLCLAGCGGGPAPSAFLVYDLDPASGRYRLQPAVIDTLTDPERGDGELARLRGGGTVRVSLATPSTEAEWRRALTMHGDQEPSIRFDVNPRGTAIPWDLDSAMMLTLYHHLERAAYGFAAAGVAPESVRKLSVYYFADVRVPFLFLPLITDNAAYMVTLDAFLIPPRVALDDVPLYANRGVVAHEYSHAVFNRLAYGDQRVPPYLLVEWPEEAVNELRSLDEGLADFFAALFTGDPRFLAASIPGELSDKRDLAVERHYDVELALEVGGDGTAEYDPYPLGTVVASALWALGGSVARDELAAAVLRALPHTPASASFRLTWFVDALVDELDPSVRAVACQLFQARLDAVAGELTCAAP